MIFTWFLVALLNGSPSVIAGFKEKGPCTYMKAHVELAGDDGKPSKLFCLKGARL